MIKNGKTCWQMAILVITYKSSARVGCTTQEQSWNLDFLGNTLMSKRKSKKSQKALDKRLRMWYTNKAPQKAEQNYKSNASKSFLKKFQKVLDKAKELWYNN